MAKWKRIEWEGGNMAGPAAAVDAIAADLKEQGHDYTVTTIKGPKTVRTTRKEVAGVELEVRTDTPLPDGDG